VAVGAISNRWFSAIFGPLLTSAEIQNRVRRTARPLRGTAKIALEAGAVVGKYKMAKHFALTDFSFARKQDAIEAEACQSRSLCPPNPRTPSLKSSRCLRAKI
jgi:hypothetical protein